MMVNVEILLEKDVCITILMTTCREGRTLGCAKNSMEPGLFKVCDSIFCCLVLDLLELGPLTFGVR